MTFQRFGVELSGSPQALQTTPMEAAVAEERATQAMRVNERPFTGKRCGGHE